MHEFVYPARFRRHRADGGFVITFRDVPEAVTQADTIKAGDAEAAAAAHQRRDFLRIDQWLPSLPRAAGRGSAVPA